ncbi:hypothetical protein BV25DRAFT_202131 [Artomyces pyxidatus]|uniref:Uncharacterized protein n=1 Tax=Artomyces pyxidatus TaxID=48021 RepID=A0ACB8T8S4_9AGAM|nr:hypothetical protein BV25DRAFT_202131 [Artomyces pyxidatus]
MTDEGTIPSSAPPVAVASAAELTGRTVMTETDALAVSEEMKLDASAGANVRVLGGRVTAPDVGIVTVTVTVAASAVEAGVEELSSSSHPPSLPVELVVELPCELSSPSSQSSSSSEPDCVELEEEVALAAPTNGKGTVVLEMEVAITPPLAPVAAMMDWALFGLVQATNWWQTDEDTTSRLVKAG